MSQKESVNVAVDEIIRCYEAWKDDDGPMAEGNATTPYEVYERHVASVLSQREKEIAEEVAEIQTQLHNGRFEEGYKLTNKLLSLLKH